MKRMICLLAMAAVLACGCARRETPVPTPVPTQGVQQAVPQWSGITLGGHLSVADVVERVSPAVVGLSVVSTGAETGEDVQGIGTGFFVDKRGYILTNHHVAGDAKSIQAILASGDTLTGECVWSDAALDLAVVKVPQGDYPAVTLGDSADLRVGDEVVAIGTPLTLQFQHTVTSGIVSALRRTLSVPSERYVTFMEELIQTDASINPGNSGGPLCALNGRVVGINTLKVSQAEGIGFSIPAEIAAPIVKRISEEGSYETPYIGLYVIDGQIARYYGVGEQEGVCVVNVDGSGPMAALGLQKGDRITHIADEQVDTALALRRAVYACRVGQSITVRWKNEAGQEKSGSVALTAKPQ
ncbi:MAG: trypsin-like peptidase domain-containing protein [Eubacteriales bacterium]|nr:trypsin-like peptidase domain-containing protein [Eubacteriales bacterium]